MSSGKSKQGRPAVEGAVLAHTGSRTQGSLKISAAIYLQTHFKQLLQDI